MAKFADTPRHKRNAKWDPHRQELVIDKRPTRAQIEFLMDLSRHLDLEFIRPRTRREAQMAISEMKAARRRLWDRDDRLRGAA